MIIARRASLALAVALLSCVNGHAQTQQARAQVGPLQAWVARGASGACQLQLRNVGDTAVVGWTVTVHSEDARYISVFRHDGWRDEFHLPIGQPDGASGRDEELHRGRGRGDR